MSKAETCGENWPDACGSCTVHCSEDVVEGTNRCVLHTPKAQNVVLVCTPTTLAEAIRTAHSTTQKDAWLTLADKVVGALKEPESKGMMRCTDHGGHGFHSDCIICNRTDM